MMKPEEYRDLSEHCYYAAQLTSNAVAQRQLLKLAESYATLADSALVLLRASEYQEASRV